MTRNITKIVAAIATLSITLAASTALAGKGGNGNGGNNGGNAMKFKVQAGNNGSNGSSNPSFKLADKIQLSAGNFASGRSADQGNKDTGIKLDTIKKIGNGNTGIAGGLGLNNKDNKTLGIGLKDLNKIGNNKISDVIKPKDKCFPDKCKDPCHDKCCHDKYHCWFPIWTYPSYCYDTTVVVERPVFIETPVPVATPVDLELVNVQFGDVGDPASGLGPRYRITVRNASPTLVGQFKVVAVAVAGNQPSPEAPPVVAVLDSLKPGEVRSLDIRLPVGALTLAHDAAGNVGPFTQLGVAIDADNQIAESNEANNSTILDRQQIPPITF